MNTLPLRSTILLAPLAFTAVACGPHDAASTTIAEVAGTPISLAEFQVVLDRDLDADGDASDEVKSRLLDQYVEERMLLEEAQRRGIEVSDDEVDRLLVGLQGPEEPEYREEVRSSLTVQKLLGAFMKQASSVSPEEEKAFYEASADEFQRPARLVVRQILLDDEAEAEAVHALVAADKSSFGEIAAERSASPDRGRSMAYSVDALPSEIAAGLEGLKPGDLSPVIAAAGRQWIFLIEEVREERSLTLEEARPEIRARLMRKKGEDALAALLQELHGRLGVRLVVENLPFQYVKEQPA